MGKAAQRKKLRRMMDNAPGAKISWDEVPKGAQREALEGIQRQYPDGFLMRYGDEIGWVFVDDDLPVIATVDSTGMIQPRVIFKMEGLE